MSLNSIADQYRGRTGLGPSMKTNPPRNNKPGENVPRPSEKKPKKPKKNK